MVRGETIMKRRKKYTMSDERKLSDLKQADFEKRIEVWMLRNQGWSFQGIGDHIGTTHQAASKMYRKIKDLTIEELERQSKLMVADSTK